MRLRNRPNEDAARFSGLQSGSDQVSILLPFRLMMGLSGGTDDESRLGAMPLRPCHPGDELPSSPRVCLVEPTSSAGGESIMAPVGLFCSHRAAGYDPGYKSAETKLAVTGQPLG